MPAKAGFAAKKSLKARYGAAWQCGDWTANALLAMAGMAAAGFAANRLHVPAFALGGGDAEAMEAPGVNGTARQQQNVERRHAAAIASSTAIAVIATALNYLRLMKRFF